MSQEIIRGDISTGGFTSLQRRLYEDVFGGLAFTRLADVSRLRQLRTDAFLRPGPDGRRPERDEEGHIRRVPYSNGEALIGRDSSGHVNSIRITRSGQTRLFAREGNHWTLETGGMRIPFPGRIEFNERNGDISYQLGRDSRRWRTEQSDGTIVNERTTATGARVALADGDHVGRITRADRSSVEAFYSGGEMTRVTEIGANGRTCVWRRQENGDWTSQGQPTRRNMVLEANGNTRYDTLDGVTHIVRGNGVELLQGRGRARYEFDQEGRITSLMLANGRGIRGIGYEGDTEYINRIVINDRRAGGTRTYRRTGHSNDWLVFNHAGRFINTATGDARMAGDGSYQIRDTRHDRHGQPRGSHVWRSFGWDGQERRVRDDNSPVTTDRTTHNRRHDRPTPHRVDDRALPPRVSDRRASTSVQEAHDRLLDAMREAHLDQPRLARMNAMMQAFEQRMGHQSEMQRAAGVRPSDQVAQTNRQLVMRTYDNLAAMVSEGGSNTFYNQSTRRFLAENFMLYAAQPCLMNQGPTTPTDREGHSTCWEKAGQTLMMAHRPDAMADFLRQVSLRGDYRPPYGQPPRTIQFSRNLLAFNGNMQESSWTLSNANNTGSRSPVGRIFDYAMPALIGRSHGNIDYGNNLQMSQIMYMMTGERPSELTTASHRGTLRSGHRSEAAALLDHGAVLRHAPGHWMSRHLQSMEINGRRQWVVIDDNQWGRRADRIIGVIDDLNDFRNRGWAAMRPLNLTPEYQRFAVANDTGIGVVNPGIQPQRPERQQPYRPQPYRPQPYRPQPIRPQPWCPT
ncbi:MAG: hypothetical protein C5B53_00700 [Candidatus Melainabacteria bacterium]|nr:MAG: hypothetical protein C5B53_00700 [Candidatus Melainabacteria bacterium]